jgi:MauM/NapG family ferredoxin protein
LASISPFLNERPSDCESFRGLPSKIRCQRARQGKADPSERILSRKYLLIKLLRIVAQSLFFGLFLYLLLGTHATGKDSIAAVERFFHFDPLLGLATFVASRAFYKVFLWALATMAITALFGRYICGWVCPLGSLLHFFSFVFGKMKWRKARLEKSHPFVWKYFTLVILLVGSLFTLDFVGFLDPLSLLYRSFVTAVLPAVSVVSGTGAVLSQQIGMTSLGDRWAQLIRNLTLNAVFRQAILLGLIFLGIILLNIVRERFWCRYICPAGALLGWLSRWSLGRVKIDEEQCNGCHVCTLHCQAQADPYPNEKWNKAECMFCFNCAGECPNHAISYPLGLPSAQAHTMSLSRRKVVFASTLGMIATPLFRVSGAERPSEKLIRPPGATPEPEFLAKCIKCGECMKACPTNGLQFASDEAGFLGIWTPILVPRIGYCEYFCSLCTQVCPTGAIKELTVKEKTETKIGSAWIKKHRCLPYSVGEPCRICEQRCPTSPKAIQLVKSEFVLQDEVLEVLVPIVDPTLCNGCGVCETKCPVLDEPGIYCTSYGESRAEKELEFPG